MLKIQIFGSGCAKCKHLAENAEAAAIAAGIEFKIEKVTDLNAMMSAGVMMTPALAIDGEVKVTGKVLNADEIQAMLM